MRFFFSKNWFWIKSYLKLASLKWGKQSCLFKIFLVYSLSIGIFNFWKWKKVKKTYKYWDWWETIHEEKRLFFSCYLISSNITLVSSGRNRIHKGGRFLVSSKIISTKILWNWLMISPKNSRKNESKF